MNNISSVFCGNFGIISSVLIIKGSFIQVGIIFFSSEGTLGPFSVSLPGAVLMSQCDVSR